MRLRYISTFTLCAALALFTLAVAPVGAQQSDKKADSPTAAAPSAIDGAALPEGRAPIVSGHVEPDSVSIGDRFVYSIEVEKDLVQSVSFPTFSGKGSEAYELIEDMPVDTLSREGRKIKIRKSFRLAAFEEGLHRVVPQVMYADKNIVDTLYSPDTIDLTVTTFQIDSTSHAIFDIKPQKGLPFKLGEISGYIKWTLAALLLIALVAYAIKRILEHYGKHFSDIFRPAPPLPPHIVAMTALEKLHEQRLWQEGKHKLYYSTLTDILRSYIVGRFGVSAMEMTSDEIIEAMHNVELPQKCGMDLTQILREADLVKFAKATPEADENEEAYRSAVDFVDQTKPEEPVEGDEDDDASDAKGNAKASKSSKKSASKKGNAPTKGNASQNGNASDNADGAKPANDKK